MKDLIENTIKRVITENQLGGQTAYRAPLLGYAQAADPLFQQLKTAVGPGHLLPDDLLPEAATVLAFFLPFTKQLVENNREHPYVARSWAIAYIETNALISLCCKEIAATLASNGVKAAWQQPTHNFDPVQLCSHWSHKHVAYICGLGEFGLHQMLITAYGCAGRFGSLVIDLPLSPSPRPAVQRCLFYLRGKCLACVKKCPSGALTTKGLDKQKCYNYLLEVDSFYSDLGVCDACGKCAACGPCAVID
ncbi:Epoxyqueuosine reductase [Pelotomaculum sp. FP]|uniref:epoxyqueuosine reductase n=1 Tax=Pelotomaculum sp. FP TaxID=261474 RepID=UPI001066356E|nr:epoxyqueuosine reductase [Pelotomaculum sp. FP]TEB15954.1 Epoxyqueuosine reductase [Pelotomaculum sp. FP]